MTDVTHILSQIEAVDPSAAEQLLPLVYDELRKVAAVRLAMEQPGQTLQATPLVHDAYSTTRLPPQYCLALWHYDHPLKDICLKHYEDTHENCHRDAMPKYRPQNRSSVGTVLLSPGGDTGHDDTLCVNHLSHDPT
jgi:hypothetical protein